VLAKLRREWPLPRVYATVLVVVFTGFAVVPLAWMLSSSIKNQADVFQLPIRWVPPKPAWFTYVEALGRYNFARYISNSLFVSAAITAISVLFSSLAGYGLAKYRFPGRDLLFLLVLATMMLPLEVILVPMFLITKQLRWLNTYQGLIVPMAVEAFGIFLMRQYVLGIPDTLIEAARIDGASEIAIFARVILPLCRPVLATLAIFSFRESWDLFMWPLIILTKDNLKTLPLGIALFENAYQSAYNELMAVAAVSLIPVTLLFFLFQRAFVQGIALTGLKE